jgi:hypothetical protein
MGSHQPGGKTSHQALVALDPKLTGPGTNVKAENCPYRPTPGATVRMNLTLRFSKMIPFLKMLADRRDASILPVMRNDPIGSIR